MVGAGDEYADDAQHARDASQYDEKNFHGAKIAQIQGSRKHGDGYFSPYICRIETEYDTKPKYDE